VTATEKKIAWLDLFTADDAAGTDAWRQRKPAGGRTWGGVVEHASSPGWRRRMVFGLAPHNPLGPVNTLTSAHRSRPSPHLVRLEHVTRHPAWCRKPVTPSLSFENPTLRVPPGTGFGVELDREMCEALSPLGEPIPGFRHRYGAVAGR